MAHICCSGTAVVATSSEPASDGRHGTRADKGETLVPRYRFASRFVIHLPFCVELLWGHAKLTVTVEVD
ncbi:MAG TPA: hypothetical protein V6C93_15020 [Allocoleopsis sp.]